MKRITISDVARRAGVSTGTVSAVLNARPTVRPATRTRVEQVIAELGYQPSPSARMLGATQSNRPVLERTVGLIIKEIDNPFYNDVVLGAYHTLAAQNYHMFLGTSEGAYEEEGTLLNAFRSRFVDGAIIAPVLHAAVDLTHLFQLKQRNYPFVLLEGVPGLQVNVVSIDNVQASKQAVHYLIEQGHERIVHLSGPPYTQHTRDRILGVQSAFSASPLTYSDGMIVPAGAHFEDGYQAALRLFGETPPEHRPTAVTCFNDLVAMGVFRALAELGLKVPDDVALIGFDDIQAAAYLSVPLTTVQVPKREMGQRAVELLLAQLEADTPPPPQHVELDAKLVLRASTKAGS